MERQWITLIFFLLSVSGWGQSADTIRQASFLQFNSQNDLYQLALKADKDFTNGVAIRFGHPNLRKWGTNWLAVPLANGISEYAWGISQEMYTPENIRTTEVVVGDRPYSGLLYLTFGAYTYNARRTIRVSSELKMGVQGPMSGAGPTQSWIHANTNNYVPAGWENQIGNGLVLDYAFMYRQLMSPGLSYLESSFFGSAQVGTIHNHATVGIQNRIGWFNSSFSNFKGVQNRNSSVNAIQLQTNARGRQRTVFENRSFQAYLQADFGFTVMVYDGTVQGSLIPFESSIYTLNTEALHPYSGFTRLGFLFSYGRTSLSYAWVVTGYQVEYSDLVGWGELKVSLSL